MLPIGNGLYGTGTRLNLWLVLALGPPGLISECCDSNRTYPSTSNDE